MTEMKDYVSLFLPPEPPPRMTMWRCQLCGSDVRKQDRVRHAEHEHKGRIANRTVVIVGAEVYVIDTVLSP